MDNPDQTPKPVTLTLSGKVTFKDDVTASQAAQIIAFVESDSVPQVSPQVLASVPSASTVPRSSNPRDALNASGAKTNPEKIVAFGIFLTQEDEGKDTFAMEDVRSLFRRAREAMPQNMSRDLEAAIRSGWIAESEVKGEYYVTDPADNVLTSGFDSLRSGKSGSTGTRKSRKAKAPETPAAFEDVDTLPDTLDQIGSYHKQPTKMRKFLWAIYLAKTLGVTELTNQDIVWLTDQLGDGIATNDIAACFRGNKAKGFVNRSVQSRKIRIIPHGEAELEGRNEPSDDAS